MDFSTECRNTMPLWLFYMPFQMQIGADMESDAAVDIDDAIAERPRNVTGHPLLDEIYKLHDALIAANCDGRVLEVAHGQYAHPEADIAVDIFEANAKSAACQGMVSDVRRLPFADNSFDSVIGRRFLHHVPGSDRGKMLSECRRVLKPGGRLIILEGTPGKYRQAVKGAAFAAGFLGEDTDDYGHLSRDELRGAINGAGMNIVEERSLGSPLMPLSFFTHNAFRRLAPLVKRSQIVQWWTFVVAEDPDECIPAESITKKVRGSADEEV